MKNVVKAIANWLCILLVLPLALPVRIWARWDKHDAVFQFGSHAVSLLPGPPGDYLRRAYYRVVLRCPAPGPTISFGTILAQRDTTISERVYIGAFCNIGSSIIESNVLIGSNVMIASPEMHRIDDCSIPIGQQGGTIERISIGVGSWLGNGAIILADVGPECVVGAGSVVVRPCEPWGIYVGNPARLVRHRKSC
jgi:virginiamycin A acetyltransferase